MARSPAAILFDANGVAMAVEDGSAIPVNTRALLFAGEDEEGKSHYLQIDSRRNLKVVPNMPSPPSGTTAVIVAQDESDLDIAGGAGPSGNPHDTDYIIPNGETFYLQIVSAGAAGDPSENGSRVDVLYDDGVDEHIMTRIYLAGQTVYVAFPDSSQTRDGTTMVGDGSTKKVILRRLRLSVAAQEVDAEIRGYVE